MRLNKLLSFEYHIFKEYLHRETRAVDNWISKLVIDLRKLQNKENQEEEILI